MSYQAGNKLDKNAWITDPRVPDPDNIPEPLGWALMVRPYPVIMDDEQSNFEIPKSELDFMAYQTNIGRVVSIGPCCWTRPEHRLSSGLYFPWLNVGDFVSFPKNVGAKRKFKGVSYVLLVDDEVVERLSDPQVFDDDFYKLDIPQEDLEKYNTIYKKKETV